jgi:hypothetical protein
MTHAQKPDFVFRRKGRVHLNRRGRQFSRLLAAEVCASAVVMLDTPCSEVVWRVLATHPIRQFPLHFPSRASPCAITFQLDSTCYYKKAMRRFFMVFGVLLIVTQPSAYTPYQSECLIGFRNATSNWGVLWLWVLTVINHRWPSSSLENSGSMRNPHFTNTFKQVFTASCCEQ